MNANKLIATECTVFKPDKLSYFFVGRPAYKYKSTDDEAEYWELPCCFIFDFSVVTGIKRIFPFDSGAFRDGLFPPYINQIPLEHYESSEAPDAPSKIIGAFFGDAKSYFALAPKSETSFNAEFSPGVFDAELKALHRLSREKSPKKFDDRRLTIEMQSTDDLDLRVTNPLAVIAPSPYFDDPSFLAHVEYTWKAVPLPYPTFSLSVNQYYSSIYERVDSFYKTLGLL
jgi:hypothetical protein